MTHRLLTGVATGSLSTAREPGRMSNDETQPVTPPPAPPRPRVPAYAPAPPPRNRGGLLLAGGAVGVALVAGAAASHSATPPPTTTATAPAAFGFHGQGRVTGAGHLPGQGQPPRGFPDPTATARESPTTTSGCQTDGDGRRGLGRAVRRHGARLVGRAQPVRGRGVRRPGARPGARPGRRRGSQRDLARPARLGRHGDRLLDRGPRQGPPARRARRGRRARRLDRR